MNIGHKAILVLIAIFVLFYVSGKIDEKNGVGNQLNPLSPEVHNATRNATRRAVEKAEAHTNLTKEQVEDISEKAWSREYNRQKALRQ